MSEKIPATVQMGTLEEGWKGTPQEFLNKIRDLILVFFNRDAAGTYSTAPTAPTSDVGAWLKNGREWRFWNPDTASYSLGVLSPGLVMAFAGANPPEGWLLCDGTQYSDTEYPELSEIIGQAFMQTPSVGYFAVPDLRGRSPIGAGTGLSNDRSTNLTTHTLAERLGEEKVKLVPGNVPPHAHKVYGNRSDEYESGGSKKGIEHFMDGTEENETLDEQTDAGDTLVSGKTGWSGSYEAADDEPSAHENLPPSIGMNFIIKT